MNINYIISKVAPSFKLQKFLTFYSLSVAFLKPFPACYNVIRTFQYYSVLMHINQSDPNERVFPYVT